MVGAQTNPVGGIPISELPLKTRSPELEESPMTSLLAQYHRTASRVLAPLTALALTACGGADGGAGDSAAAAADTAAGQVATAPATDSSMAGMQHGTTA